MIKLLQIGSIDKPRLYAGIGDMAIDGLHNDIIKLVKGHKILDLGAGEGELTQRMLDAGYDVAVSEIGEHKTKANNFPVNFNNAFWGNRFCEQYDTVIACEVIEHVQCPYNFIREASRLINKDGQLIISTPNTENPISKAIFLLRGQYFLFRDCDLSYGHISPTTESQIKNTCRENHLVIEKIVLGGTYPIIYIHRNLKDTVLWSLIALTGLLLSKNQSPSKIYVIKKDNRLTTAY
jgi:2-polyprenyl-3-methyl-5-hydroxy-6-metoxy-1,4-benzoquinol methylase